MTEVTAAAAGSLDMSILQAPLKRSNKIETAEAQLTSLKPQSGEYHTLLFH